MQNPREPEPTSLMPTPITPFTVRPRNLDADDLVKMNELSTKAAQASENLQDFLEGLRKPYGLPSTGQFSVNNYTGRITLQE